MKSYKIEIEKTYCIDVQADTDKEAEDLAETMLDSYMKNGIEHYHQTGDTVFTAYDVTGTDDDAFLQQDLEEVAELEEKLSHDKEWTNQ